MLLMEDEKETSFGATVRQAWEVTNEKGSELSELMLLCWVFVDNAQNCIAHRRKLTIADAKRRILRDFTPYGHLGTFAVSLVDRHPGSFSN
jgi:hypothetical protein